MRHFFIQGFRLYPPVCFCLGCFCLGISAYCLGISAYFCVLLQVAILDRMKNRSP